AWHGRHRRSDLPAGSGRQRLGVAPRGVQHPPGRARNAAVERSIEGATVKPDETGLIDDLLKRRAQVGGVGAAAGGPLCGDPELMAAYAENSLDEEGRESLQIHLASCAACREAVATLVRMAPREVLTDLAAPSASWWKQWIWAPALAVLLIAGSV